MIFGRRTAAELRKVKARLAQIEARSSLLDDACGVGLWDAELFEGDAMHARSRWNWSAEFRRLVGYETEAEYPNVVQSWSDRLHPDDVAPTFQLFTACVNDPSDSTKYDAVYRLKVRDGSYRWFRATGNTRHSPDGRTVLACGSLVDVHEEKTLAMRAEEDAEEYRAGMAAVGTALKSLAAGDLTCVISEAIPGRFRQIRDDFNAALARLEESIDAVSTTSFAVRTGAGEIASSSHDLSRRTEQQAASVEQTATNLSEVTNTVRKTSESAMQARTVVEAASEAAQNSSEVVRQAVQAMEGIERSSGQIGQIIGVIDEIAFQTNLLALNAGVEAARAGDAGRGFAVVASEVRALAQRSAEAAKEIKSLISASAQQVGSGVKLVAQTGTALERIATQVNEINRIVSEIASGAQEQSTSLGHISAAVKEVDTSTQQNAAMVEQATAACAALAHEAEELARLMTNFRTGRSGGAAAPTARASGAMRSGGYRLADQRLAG